MARTQPPYTLRGGGGAPAGSAAVGDAAAARPAAGQGRRWVDDLALSPPHRKCREVVCQPTVGGPAPAAALGFAPPAPGANAVTGAGGVATSKARGSRPQHTILWRDVDTSQGAKAFALSRTLPHAHDRAHSVSRRPSGPAVGALGLGIARTHLATAGEGH